jgi:ArsR family transcriptional regulator
LTVLAKRSETSREFFASGAGQWDRVREDLFGHDFAAAALLAWLPSKWTVADLGCGTGAMLPLVAPHVRQVIGVDASDEMLATARLRTADLANVDLRRGSLESLPIEDAAVNAAMTMLVLHHLPSPAAALREAGRILVPNGRLLVVDMAPHEHEEYRQEMGHIWLGFTPAQMRKWLADAGFVDISVHPLPASAAAKGPALFAAAARRAIV